MNVCGFCEKKHSSQDNMNKHIRIIIVLFAMTCYKVVAQDIFDVARSGNMAKMEELVKLKPDTVNARNEHGFTPLIIAAYRNQLRAVEFLLKHKADIHATSPEGPVILAACYKGNLELTELLLKYNADVNAQNDKGTSALMYAALSNNLDLVKLLLKHGASKILVEKSGKTALDYAKMNNSAELTALLMD